MLSWRIGRVTVTRVVEMNLPTPAGAAYRLEVNVHADA